MKTGLVALGLCLFGCGDSTGGEAPLPSSLPPSSGTPSPGGSAGAVFEPVAETPSVTPGLPEPTPVPDPVPEPDPQPSTPTPIALPAVGMPQGSPGRLEQLSFQGPISQNLVSFNVYLPPGYDSDPNVRYPVAYRLHGMTDSRDTRNDLITRDHERALLESRTCPFIIVFPEAAYNSFYADSKSGEKPIETQIIRELLPQVDQSFRTVADRRARVLHGWSMGGFGAMLYASKFPELFTAAVSHDGGLRSWLQLGDRPEVQQEIYDNDEAYYDLYSPFTYAKTNAAAIAQNVAIRLVVSQWTELNRPFAAVLDGNAIAYDYLEIDCDHVEECVVEREGPASWSFIFAAVSRAASG